jgi:hypothetical protein
MKAYGYSSTNTHDFSFPDIVDGIVYGRKSSAINLPGKGGDIRSNIKSSAKKRNNRRIMKKAERRNATTNIKKEISWS